MKTRNFNTTADLGPSYAGEANEAYDSSTKQSPAIAMLNITRTITDHIPMIRDPSGIGLTIGQQIDNHLGNAALEHVQIQTVALEFEPDAWREFADGLRQRGKR